MRNLLLKLSPSDAKLELARLDAVRGLKDTIVKNF
jgi:hypothetical protein